MSYSTKNISRPVKTGQDYYIKVWPRSSYSTGTYQIAFNASSTAPVIIETLPSDAIPLAEGIWEDGNLPESKSVQWFKFNASENTHYIHAAFGTMSKYDGVNVQLYDSIGVKAGPEGRLAGDSSISNKTFSVTSGQEYYIKVWPYSSYNDDAGSYQIAFNTSSTAPSLMVTPLPSAIPLTENIWTDGNLPESRSVQWFKFTATVSGYQFVHVSFGTLNSRDGVNVQLYNSSGEKVEKEEKLYVSDSTISRPLMINQVYHIKVRPASSTGTYQITFSQSYIAPITPPTDGVIQLTENKWSAGELTSETGVQLFKFTATAGTQYIHAAFDSLYQSWGINIQVYDASGAAVGDKDQLYIGYSISKDNISRPVKSGDSYYIKVWPYNTSYLGTYRIGFTTSSATKPSP